MDSEREDVVQNKTSDGAHIATLPHSDISPRDRYDATDVLPGGLARVIRDVFTSEECARLIETSEALGYDRALTTDEGVQVYQPDMRNCGRCMVDDAATAGLGCDPLKFRKVNPRVRFVKYGPGQFFGMHYDDNFYDESDHTVSVVTIQIYLDEDMTGGGTRFHVDGATYVVEPRVGSVLVFDQQYLHEGMAVLDGCKHIIRTEGMYDMYKSSRTTVY